jgi:hypothetical protein
MDQETPIDYYKMFRDLVHRCSELTRQRDELETEIVKVRQLVIATFLLIPEDQQKVFRNEVDAMDQEGSLGLLEAIKLVFSAHRTEWLTLSNVRDYLGEDTGFDFGRYRANPLASIAATLKRMVPNVVESIPSGNGTLYRRKLTLADRIAGWTNGTKTRPSAARRAGAE